jgi:DNA polymerase III subunit delta'
MPLSDVRGQNGALKALRRALERDRLPNAYLFEGPSGVGKQTTAVLLASAALCAAKPHEGCGECAVCTRIRAENHPDVRLFRPRAEGNRNLQVELVRSEILPVAQFAPFEAKQAFLIFPEADISFPEQHPEAANALLKTLEEPRPNVCFVLLAERPERLLVTIRSRCQRVRFGTLPPLVLEHVLELAGVAPDLRASAIALSEGRADRALALVKDDLASKLLERALRVDRTLALRDPGRAVELAEELAKAPDLTLVLDTLAAYYRDVAVCGLGMRDRLRFGHARSEIEERARKLAPQVAAARAARLFALPELFARNANPQIVLDQLLVELADP